MRGENSNISNRNILVILIMCVSCLLPGCNNRQHEARTSAGKPEPVSIGVATQVLSAPLLIALEKGFFTDEGLNVTVKEYSFGKLALEAMLAGEVELATVAATPIVMNSFKRNDFSVISMFVYSYDESKLIVRKDRGINKATDLKGKRIGTPFGTSGQFYLVSYLSDIGYALSDVEAVNISAKDLPAALKSGEVDAIVGFEPFAYEALKLLQNNAMRFPRNEVAREPFNLVGTKDFQKKHAEAVKRVLRAIDKAVAFIKQHKEESIAMLGKKLNMDEKYLHECWGDYVFELSLDQALLVGFEDMAGWAMKSRLTDRTDMPNYLDFINVDTLRSIKPEAIRIIR